MSRRVGGSSGAGAVALLLLAAPTPAVAVESLHAPLGADTAAPVVAAAALVAWALAGWLTAVTGLVLASRLPGAAGSLGAAAGRWLAPHAVRRTVEVALGLTVSVGVLAAPAAAAAPDRPAASRPPAGSPV
ncbi:MAG TPA: hypothetical protein VNU26_04765, partial [Mycobacteriales bacterium]|nr:hypothetical protein [Mycobacteriales bacterium]